MTRSHRSSPRGHVAPPTAPRVVPTLALLLAAALVGCGGDSSAGRSAESGGPATVGPAAGPATAAEAAPAPGASAAAGDGCPMYGAWQRCSVIERLERAGFGVTPLSDSVTQPELGIAGAAYQLGAAELQLFLYADSAGAARAAASLDADEAEPAATRGIRRAPAVIRTGNLVALLFNNNDRQLERVQLALTAGLPARGPDAP